MKCLIIICGFLCLLGASSVVADVLEPFKISPRIAHGRRAVLGTFPWYASLHIRLRNDIFNQTVYCGGAILNRLWILTSADCTKNAQSIQVNVGSINFHRPAVTVSAEAVFPHPAYNERTFANNLALLRLPANRALNFSNELHPTMYPIQLPALSQHNVTFEQQEVYFQGFGYTAFGNNNMSDSLLYTKQRVISNQACLPHFNNNAQLVPPTSFCAISYDIREGLCNGDGGGPMTRNEFGTWTLIGIASFLHSSGSCGRQAVPAVHSRLTSRIYTDWISRTARYQFRP